MSGSADNFDVSIEVKLNNYCDMARDIPRLKDLINENLVDDGIIDKNSSLNVIDCEFLFNIFLFII
jgi:hypothetical protein